MTLLSSCAEVLSGHPCEDGKELRKDGDGGLIMSHTDGSGENWELCYWKHQEHVLLWKGRSKIFPANVCNFEAASAVTCFIISILHKCKPKNICH